MTFTAEEKMNCALRELRMRERVYAGWVEKGRMTAEKSERERALMAAIVEDYRALVEKELPHAALIGIGFYLCQHEAIMALIRKTTSLAI